MSANPSEFAWQMLESAPQQEITTRDSDVKIEAGSVLHSLDLSGHRHLLLPVRKGAPDLEDSRSRGVTVRTRTLLRGPADMEQTYIDVKCEDPALKDLFSKVCDEILQHCGETPGAPGLAVTVVLERWRELLGPTSRKLLTEQQLKGLLAELHVLETIVAISPQHAMTVWTGVDHARHDFTGLRAACEVKASSLQDEIKVHVNGLNQLAPPPASELYLAVERFERVPAGGDSLSGVMHRLEHAGLDRHAILTAVAKVGVRPADLEAYATIRFRSLERRIYKVDKNFPCLTAELLTGKPGADRISNVEYVLNLGAQPPIPLGDDAIEKLPAWLLSGVEAN